MNIVIGINAGKLPLLAGIYTVDVWFGDRRGNHIDRIDGAIEFEVVAVGENDVGPPLVDGFGYTGSFYYPSKWTHISSHCCPVNKRINSIG